MQLLVIYLKIFSMEQGKICFKFKETATHECKLTFIQFLDNTTLIYAVLSCYKLKMKFLIYSIVWLTWQNKSKLSKEWYYCLQFSKFFQLLVPNITIMNSFIMTLLINYIVNFIYTNFFFVDIFFNYWYKMFILWILKLSLSNFK